ncbi:MAG: laccase domain-containing protein, partial [Clostridia bacterium]|nr:laccase domain-containing protein [Clostridia bacterium]
MIRYGFFNDENVIAGFSERGGGVSPMPEYSLNLSFSREPDGNRENVLENYRIASYMLGIGTDSVTRMPQVHGSDILTVLQGHRGMGVTRTIDAALAAHGYDGMITDVPGITLSTTHADCTPVLLFDPVKRAIGAVHSGWKGTCLKIAARAVERMTAEFGSEPADIKAIIGPAISKACFE